MLRKAQEKEQDDPVAEDEIKIPVVVAKVDLDIVKAEAEVKGQDVKGESKAS